MDRKCRVYPGRFAAGRRWVALERGVRDLRTCTSGESRGGDAFFRGLTGGTAIAFEWSADWPNVNEAIRTLYQR